MSDVKERRWRERKRPFSLPADSWKGGREGEREKGKEGLDVREEGKRGPPLISTTHFLSFLFFFSILSVLVRLGEPVCFQWNC